MKNAAIHPFQAPAARAISPALATISTTAPGNVRTTSPVAIRPYLQPVATPTPVPEPHYLDRLLVRKARRILLVKTGDIQLIEASGNYVRIITEDASHLLRTPLSELATQLDPAHFLRVHRSAIINTEFLESVETNPAGDYFLRLPQGRRLKCSRSYRGDLRLFLQGFGSQR